MIDAEGFNELKLCRSGPMLYNKNDWPIGESLRKYGEFSWQEIEVCKKLVRPGSLVIDAGANIGTLTVELSRVAGQVLAFEPQSIAFQTLCANLALNHRTNVRAFHAALGKESGWITVPVRDQSQPNNFGGVPLAGATEGDTVQLMHLDRFSLGDLSLIKADIEGMEAEMLEGAAKTIERHRPTLYIEADGDQAVKALQMLMDWRYECYWHFPRIFSPQNFMKIRENIFVKDGKEIVSCNAVCLAAERNIEVTDLVRIESPDENGWDREHQRRKKESEAALV